MSHLLGMFHQLLGQAGPPGGPSVPPGGQEARGAGYSFQLYQFSEVGPMEGPLPKPRSGHRIVHHQGRIYSFGGFNPSVDGADPDLQGDAYWQVGRLATWPPATCHLVTCHLVT